MQDSSLCFDKSGRNACHGPIRTGPWRVAIRSVFWGFGQSVGGQFGSLLARAKYHARSISEIFTHLIPSFRDAYPSSLR